VYSTLGLGHSGLNAVSGAAAQSPLTRGGESIHLYERGKTSLLTSGHPTITNVRSMQAAALRHATSARSFSSQLNQAIAGSTAKSNRGSPTRGNEQLANLYLAEKMRGGILLNVAGSSESMQDYHQTGFTN
jgi:hypothetical protein